MKYESKLEIASIPDNGDAYTVLVYLLEHVDNGDFIKLSARYRQLCTYFFIG